MRRSGGFAVVALFVAFVAVMLSVGSAHDAGSEPSGGTGAGAGTGTFTLDLGAASVFPPPRPVMPAQYRAKAKVWLGADPNQPPVLLLYHHDELRLRSREDYYHLVGNRHERYFTSIKLQNTGQNYMIMHKQPKSPRACFITPLLAPLFDATAALETAVYVGPATVEWWTDHIDRREGQDAMESEEWAEQQRRRAAGTAADGDGGPQRETGSGSGAGGSTAPADAGAGAERGPRRHLSNVTCAHWRMAYEGERVELCLHRDSGAPMLVHHPYIRAHILDWSVPSSSAETDDPFATPASSSSSGASPLTFSDALFDPMRASVAKCAPFGASTVGQRH